MKKLLKLLFLFTFTLALTTSCSDDDDDDNGKVDNLAKIENFTVTIVSEYSSNTYQYSWKGVKGAYSYQVLYRVKGSSDDWQETNVYIPSSNMPGQIMTHTMMGGYSRGVVYEMQIVACRDTAGKIIAESDIIESEALPLPQ
ncbi:hypothetical protein [Dysgonomonas sp. 520]|uniref:hypothetical protein n=1 Tax=Dysgonomonas sp. 520 TaxID=2302931 RepID=UPI0013D63490|nr:hypothetical protein [Dysgonomonas sp. 520]NDW11010.1 hypothetical protein [Dysgonomonas sp. 520]